MNWELVGRSLTLGIIVALAVLMIILGYDWLAG